MAMTLKARRACLQAIHEGLTSLLTAHGIDWLAKEDGGDEYHEVGIHYGTRQVAGPNWADGWDAQEARFRALSPDAQDLIRAHQALQPVRRRLLTEEAAEARFHAVSPPSEGPVVHSEPTSGAPAPQSGRVQRVKPGEPRPAFDTSW